MLALLVNKIVRNLFEEISEMTTEWVSLPLFCFFGKLNWFLDDWGFVNCVRFLFLRSQRFQEFDSFFEIICLSLVACWLLSFLTSVTDRCLLRQVGSCTIGWLFNQAFALWSFYRFGGVAQKFLEIFQLIRSLLKVFKRIMESLVLSFSLFIAWVFHLDRFDGKWRRSIRGIMNYNLNIDISMWGCLIIYYHSCMILLRLL